MKLLENLNPEQLKAVTHKEGPLLIVAGAGTGKTTVITQRIAWLVEQKKAASDEILALTFTDKAAGEMEERVDKLLPYGYLDLWISTFHAFAERILKSHALEIGLCHDFKLLNQTESWLLVRQNLEKFNLDYYRPLGNPTKFIHALVKHFSRAKDEEIRPEEYLEYVKNLKLDGDSEELIQSETARLKEIAEAYHVYEQLLLNNNALDFGDLICYTLRLFRERPAILEKYREQFKYILVDEFQDTNWAQYELVKMLAAPRNNLTVCGDDDQSVYKFRGASISNILTFKKDFSKSEEIFLIKNYRNQQNILDLSYNFIQLNNPNRLEYQLNRGSDGARAVTPSKSVGGIKGQFSKKLVAENEGEGVIEHLHQKTLSDEVRAVMEKIIELKNENKDSSWNDFAILVRANHTANPFIAELARVNIPYQFLASRGLYAKPIILDILAYLKLLDDYHESPAVYRVLNLEVFSLPSKEIVELNYLARRKNLSLYEALEKASAYLKLKEESIKIINRFLGLVEKHTSLVKEKNISVIILDFLEDSGYLKYLSQKDDQKSRESLSYLNQFYKQIVEFEREAPDKSLKAFMEELNYVLESGEEGALSPDFEEGPEAVKILTIHAAKGLEFRYVFVVSMVDKRFPTIERNEPIELPDELVKEIVPQGDIHLEEERRLFYVAMTRAREGLFFTSALEYGGTRKKKLSRFLSEVGIVGKIVETEILRSAVTDHSVSVSTIFCPSPREGRGKPFVSLPLKFSFTQLRSFENCPYQYRFAHILHIPIKGKATFSFGKTIHHTLFHFFELALEKSDRSQNSLFGDTQKKFISENIKELVSQKELLEIYEKNWLDEWYESKFQKEEYKKNGRAVLKKFYENLPADQVLPKYLEQGFNFKIGNYTIKGAIDRVDEIEAGKLEIIDYKTGRSRKDGKLTPEDKEQLLIYQMAVAQIFPEEPVKLSYYYIEENEKVSFLGEDKGLATLKEKIQKEIEEIHKSDFLAKPSQLCKFCDFREICEYRLI